MKPFDNQPSFTVSPKGREKVVHHLLNWLLLFYLLGLQYPHIPILQIPTGSLDSASLAVASAVMMFVGLADPSNRIIDISWHKHYNPPSPINIAIIC